MPHRDRDHRELKYDPADFVIPAQDAKGHSERFQCRLQPGDDRALDVIVGSKKFPFRTKGDVGRWAIHVGIRRLEQMEAVPSVTAEVDAMIGILRDEMFHHEFQATFDAMDRVISTHIGAQAYGEARRVVALMRDRISKMPDGYWKEKYDAKVLEKHGHLLEVGQPHAPAHTPGKVVKKSGPGASLRRTGTHDDD
jgi:hypothetical protein